MRLPASVIRCALDSREKYSNVDFDDASSNAILQTVNGLKARGIKSIDSFIVPHHGSGYHDIEPILSLSPRTAIISVNPRNPYGHPSPSILISLMDKLGSQNVFFTGSIDHVVLDPNGVKHAKYAANQTESFNLFCKTKF
jgi:beta-lactamase superfamily II metal-dependent hydrolase